MSVIITFLKKNKGHIVIRTSGRVSAVAIRKIQKSLQMSEHLLAAQLIDILKSRSEIRTAETDKLKILI